MAKLNRSRAAETENECRPSLTPEAKTAELINLSMTLAERKLRDGTASSQLITHFLKLAADEERDQLEKDILSEQRKLYAAKTKSIEAHDKSDELYMNAVEAMKSYQGRTDE